MGDNNVTTILPLRALMTVNINITSLYYVTFLIVKAGGVSDQEDNTPGGK